MIETKSLLDMTFIYQINDIYAGLNGFNQHKCCFTFSSK